MIALARTKQRLTALHEVMLGSVKRRCVGTQSPARCLYNIGIDGRSTSSKKSNPLRYFSSARPLPDDEHEELAWTYDDDSRVRQAKRGRPFSNTQDSLSKLSSNVSTLIPSTKMNSDTDTVINHWTVEEHVSSEIASNSSIANDSLTAASIAPSLKPNEGDTATSVVTLEEDVTYTSPSTLRYTGDAVIPITSNLHIVKPQDDTPRGIWPVFRLLVRRLKSSFRLFIV